MGMDNEYYKQLLADRKDASDKKKEDSSSGKDKGIDLKTRKREEKAKQKNFLKVSLVQSRIMEFNKLKQCIEQQSLMEINSEKKLNVMLRSILEDIQIKSQLLQSKNIRKA